MIGEIRDAATATTALQAALTGHRLLSSMHTLTGAEALIRLRQMGAPAYVISSALAGVLSLRLVRLLCPECRRPRPLTEEEVERFPESAAWPVRELAESPGCPACLGSGHHGRTGLGEWLIPTAETAAALSGAEAAAAIARTLAARVSARPAALELLRAGRIAPAELQRLSGLATLEEVQRP
jgi:general secretion pathway protein E